MAAAPRSRTTHAPPAPQVRESDSPNAFARFQASLLFGTILGAIAVWAGLQVRGLADA